MTQELNEKLDVKFANIEVSIQAIALSIVELLSKLLPDKKEEIEKEYTNMFMNAISRIKGVDNRTNESIGKVIITKYNRGGEVKQWNIKDRTT